MNVLTYFVPNAGEGITHKAIVAAGLGYAYRHPMAVCECTGGPSGDPGVLITFGPGAGTIELNNNRQRWRRIPSCDAAGAGAWVGACCDLSFVAAEFARPSLLLGEGVELGAGGEWIIPTARGCNAAADSLEWHITPPTAIEYNDAGEWVNGAVIPKYLSLWDAAVKFWDGVVAEILAADSAGELDDEPVTMAFGDLQDHAVATLQANYAIGPTEVSLLSLFDSGSANNVLLALVGWFDYQRWSKKKLASGTLGFGDGSSAATQDTVPA